MQIDRNEPWLAGHEAGTLDHEIGPEAAAIPAPISVTARSKTPR
jgi:hypothetical protein